MYQMVIKSQWNIPNGRKMCQHYPTLGPQKFAQIVIFGMKINHLATLKNASDCEEEFLHSTSSCRRREYLAATSSRPKTGVQY
jgi:hypothetical protein